jgi:hypothetical protein
MRQKFYLLIGHSFVWVTCRPVGLYRVIQKKYTLSKIYFTKTTETESMSVYGWKGNLSKF